MKGCRPRQGVQRSFSSSSSSFDQRQSTRDEPVVQGPWCRWANSSSHFVPCWYFVNYNKGISAQIQTTWEINMQWSWWTLTGPGWWTFSVATEIRDDDPTKLQAPTKALCWRLMSPSASCLCSDWAVHFPAAVVLLQVAEKKVARFPVSALFCWMTEWKCREAPGCNQSDQNHLDFSLWSRQLTYSKSKYLVADSSFLVFIYSNQSTRNMLIRKKCTFRQGRASCFPVSTLIAKLM